MRQCLVCGTQCRTEKDTPMVWHWLCEECATECADRHRRETGHPVDLQVTIEPIADQIRKTCQVAAILSHRARFW